ncbi:hypothetical protein MBLNU459_g6047t1 [Dothideomycetes sp. NU459]
MALPRRLLSSPSTVTAATIGAGAAYYGFSAQSDRQSKGNGLKAAFPSFGFVNLTLQESQQVNHDTKLLRFRLPESSSSSGLSPISSLLTRHWGSGSWLPTFRPYTPISTGDDPTTVSLLVKQYPGGRASSHLHSLQPGQTLAVRALPEFAYAANRYSRICMIAGGAGITPMAQMINTVLQDPADETRLDLVYANRTKEDILLKSALDELQQRFPERLRVRYVVGDAPVEEGNSRRITKEILGQMLPDPTAKTDKPVKVLVCGPDGMMAAIAGKKGPAPWMQGSLGGYLKELGWREDQVQKF